MKIQMKGDVKRMEAIRAFLASRDYAAKYRETVKRKTKEVMPFVTISRQAGAGGTSVAEQVVEYLKEKDENASREWTLFEDRLIDKVIEDHNLPADMGRFMTESGFAETRDLIESLVELHPPAFSLVKKVSETMLHLAKMGHCVLMGRGGAVVAAGLTGGVHVRLVGAEEKRVLSLQDLFGLEKKEALRKMTELDKERRDYVKQYFNKNINDPLLYSLVINTDRIPYDAAARLIGEEILRVRQQSKEQV